MRGICIINEDQYLNERVRTLVLQNFRGILFAGKQEGLAFYLANKEKLGKSMDCDCANIETNPELQGYYDEVFSCPEVWKETWVKYPKAIIGELTDDKFDRLLLNPITYTCYKKIWHIKIEWLGIDWRLQLPRTNQLSTWKHIVSKYGSHRMPMVWVKFGQSSTLTDWAVMNGKSVWYYTESVGDKLIKELESL